MKSKWSRNYEACTECGTKERAHVARGLCSTCYMKMWNAIGDHAQRQKKHKRQWYEINMQGSDRQKMIREQQHFKGNRQAALERDGWACQTCKSKGPLVVHHKDFTGRKNKDRNHDIDQLVTLCRACHCCLHKPVSFRKDKI